MLKIDRNQKRFDRLAQTTRLGGAALSERFELLRRLAFAKDVPPPDLPEQFSLALEEE